ncbi:alpha-L-fucosidase, partial [Asticcacaulis biprosthecium]|uniref:alpha-L-fucosidase n=1 Tax=Asticcacaulis biprosthecium TaxID=76891 RepID=UPI00058C10A0
RTLLAGTAAVLAAPARAWADPFFQGTPPSGPFQPYWESLKSYTSPDWFRDAKFGIWAHWSPQCVPEQGDWYARNMYIQGMAQNDFHTRTYGHPSVFGYKDICNLWKAERWDPDGLVKLYKAAGAEYLVSLATHHDNFDCWDSAHQPWNSVNIGPRRDIVGGWAKAARANDLRFGISYHGTPHRTWDEFLPVRYKSDTTGPFAGVAYDGMQTLANGEGKWWQGMDPQMLNGKPHLKNTPCPEFVQQFMLRVQDVIDKYDPDMLTFDDGVEFSFDAGGPYAPDLGVWLGIPDLAPQIMAYFYNRNLERRGGRLDGVVNLKNVPEPIWGTLTRSFEMLFADKIQDSPWQTEACIGDWHYNRARLTEHRYRKPELMIPLFVDIVSKNGNLLLGIPLPGHGEPDGDEIAFLQAFADWQRVNAEAIKGSRPWTVFGEGPSTQVKVEAYQLEKLRFDHRDIRFTTKGEVLYAIAQGWPADGKLTVRSLATGSPHYRQTIGKVELLGSHARLQWTRSSEGLEISLPPKAPSQHAVSFRIQSA